MTKPQPITIHTQTIILKRDGQNNENTTQYTNKNVCGGCTERTLVVSFLIPLFNYKV